MRTPVCTLLAGHAIAVLDRLPENHFHTVVTSPPYWGLRSYKTEPVVWGGDPAHQHKWPVGPKRRMNRHHSQGLEAWSAENASGGARKNGEMEEVVMPYARCSCGAVQCELGHESTPEEFVAHLVEVFRAVRRVLREDGTLWVVIGDCYARDAGVSHPPRSNSHGQWFDTRGEQRSAAAREHAGFGRPPEGTKHKDIVGIPWLFAFAMRADGWWLRRPIIWDKPNVIPESVSDRPTSSHENVFLFAKSEVYFYDKHAVLEPNTMRPQRRPNGHKRRKPMAGMPGHSWSGTARGELAVDGYPEGRNLRDVWRIPTRAFSGREYVADLVDRHRMSAAWWSKNRTKGSEDELPPEIGPLVASPECPQHAHLASWRYVLIHDTPSVLGRNEDPCRCLRVDADHFAVFPPELAARPVRAGTSEAGCCADCGAPRQRVVGRACDACGELVPFQANACPACNHKRDWKAGRKASADLVAPTFDGANGRHTPRLPGNYRSSVKPAVATGNDAVRGDGGVRSVDPTAAGGNVLTSMRIGSDQFEPTCDCGVESIPCRVLDPFGGAGTTPLTAALLGRDATIVELRRDYIAIEAGRLAEAGLDAVLWDGTRVARYRPAKAAAARAIVEQVEFEEIKAETATPGGTTASLFEGGDG